MNNIEHLKKISLDGGVLCLDFINTLSDYSVETPINYITNEAEWLTWLKRVGLAKEEFADFEAGSFNLSAILDVRQTLYELFSHYARSEVVPGKVLSKFNKFFKEMSIRLKFVLDEKEILQLLEYDKRSATEYLMPIIESAGRLLTSPRMKNVKECPNCGWIFLDQTKSQTRRWCNMKACGNKIKTQKYYKRTSTKT